MRFVTILAILVAFSTTLMCEEEKEHEFSSRTQYYLKVHQKNVERLQKKYLEELEKVNNEVVENLENMVKRALRKDDLEEAVALKKKIEEIQNSVKRDMLGEVIVEKENGKFTSGDKLQIGKATWGLKGGKTVDVTDIIKEMVVNNSLRVQAHPKNGFNKTKNGDPAYGKHKTLTIVYKLNGKINTIEAIDPNWIEINIPE